MKLDKEEYEKFKKCESNITPNKKSFCGARGVTLSEEAMTEEIKKGYVDFFEAISRSDFSYREYEYLDIYTLKEVLEGCSEITKEIFKLYYGLETGKRLSSSKIAAMFNMSKTNIFSRMNTAIRQIKRTINSRVNVKSKLLDLAGDSLEYQEIQTDIKAIEAIKQYISGHLHEGKIDLYTISPDEVGVEAKSFRRVAAKITGTEETIENLEISPKLHKILRLHNIETLFDMLHYSKQDVLRFRNVGKGISEELERALAEKGIELRDDGKNAKRIEKPKEPKSVQIGDITIFDMNLSTRAFNILYRNNVQNISEITKYSIEQLLKFRNMGKKSLEEILGSLEKYGVKVDEDGNLAYPENAEIVIAPEVPQGQEDLDFRTKRDEGFIVNNELLERCDLVLREYQAREQLLNIDRKEELYDLCRELLRYQMARTNYLEKEDIFNPNGIVDGVPFHNETLSLEELKIVKQLIDRMVDGERAALSGEHNPIAVIDLENAIRRLEELDKQRSAERNYVCTYDGTYTESYSEQIEAAKQEIEKIIEMKGRSNTDVQSGLSIIQMYYRRMCALKVPNDLDDFFVRSPYVKTTEWYLEKIAEFAQDALDEERKAVKPSEEKVQKLEIAQSLLSDIIQEKEEKKEDEIEISEEDRRKVLIAQILQQQKELAGLKDTLKELEADKNPTVYDE